MITFSQKTQLYADLRIFLCIIASLIVIGGLFIYSASSAYALETFGSSHYFVKRQTIGIILGLIATVIARLIPIKLMKKMSPLLLLGALMITSLTLLPQFSRSIHGSSRWLRFAALSFQPSELIKIGLVLYIGHFLEETSLKHQLLFQRLIPLFGMLGLMSMILLKQPDFGLTVTLLLTTLCLFFIAQFRLKNIIITIIGLGISGFVLIVMKSYRLKRVLTFLNPSKDPQGAGFQIIQSLIAIGSGSWLGTGIAHSKQKFFYLPMQYTDFIFSIIGEETGFIGSLFLIMLFMLFCYFGIRIANKLNNGFATLVTLGFVLLTSLQAVINIAVATGLAPTKGMGLPFVSYGNTALVCNLFMVGVIINLVHEDCVSI